MTKPPAPRSFRNRAEFRRWLMKNHDRRSELILRCFTVGAAGDGMTYREALEEALCFGWIDGIRRSLDGRSFSVRFTPRKPKSSWSAVNIRHATELMRKGKMTAPGLAAFRARVKSAYSFESRERTLPPAYLRKFRSHRRAWAFYEKQPAWIRRVSAFWVLSAKKVETRERRFAVLLSCSDQGKLIGPLGQARR